MARRRERDRKGGRKKKKVILTPFTRLSVNNDYVGSEGEKKKKRETTMA
jgi:hypothetical protein